MKDDKKTKSQLVEELKRFRSFYENAPLGFLSLDANGNIIEFNESWSNMLGYAREEILGKSFSDFVSADSMECVNKIFADYQTMGDLHSAEIKLVRKDASELTVSLDLRIAHNEDGSVTQINCALRYITNSIQTTKELSLAAFAQHNPAPVLRTDLDGKITLMNPAAENLFGTDSGGESITSVFPNAVECFCKSASNNLPLQFEQPVGNQVLLFSVQRHELTQSIYFYGSDITASKQSEDELRANEQELRKLSFAIEQSSNTVIITDTDGIIEYVNPKYTEVSGYTAAEAIGQTPRIVKSGNTPREIYVELWKTITSGKTWCGELHNKRKNGELYWEKTTITPITDKSGATISYLAIKEDVTEQKELEKERQSLEIEMNQARKLEAVGSLAAGIAHEINTPIQFVGDNTNFLSDSFKSLISLVESYETLWQEARDGGDMASLDFKKVKAEADSDLEFLRGEIPIAIEQTLEGVQRVTRIVRAMKNFAHSDQGTMSMSDINDMLESTLTVAHNELKYVADIETNFDRDLLEIECYRDDLNQVFLNLLVNAAHTIADVIGDGSSGKGVITISTMRNNDDVIIKISDTGKGIPKSIQNRIFDPFFSTKEVGKGSGQGLSIARKIVVEKHGGSLDFETQQGKGTTFIISIPVRIHEESVEAV